MPTFSERARSVAFLCAVAALSVNVLVCTIAILILALNEKDIPASLTSLTALLAGTLVAFVGQMVARRMFHAAQEEKFSQEERGRAP